MTSANLRNVKQVIDTYVDKIIVCPDKVEVKLNLFPDFNLEVEDKEKNRPITECVPDIQGQFLSSFTSKSADDFGGDEEDRTLDLTDANRTLSRIIRLYATQYESLRWHMAGIYIICAADGSSD